MQTRESSAAAMTGTAETAAEREGAPRQLDAVRRRRNRRLEALAPILLQLVARGLSLLPLSVAHALARIVANIQWLLGARAARTTQENIERCFPALAPDCRRRLARQSLTETAKTFFEMGLVWHGSPNRAGRLVESVQGMQHVESAPGAVLVLMPHFGNWELLGHVFGSGPGLTCLYAPPRSRAWSRSCVGREPVGVCAWHPPRPRPEAVLRRCPCQRHRRLVARSDTAAIRRSRCTILRPGRPDDGAGSPLIMRVQPRVVMAWVERTQRGFAAHIEPLHGDVYSADAATSAAAMNVADRAGSAPRPSPVSMGVQAVSASRQSFPAGASGSGDNVG